MAAKKDFWLELWRKSRPDELVKRWELTKRQVERIEAALPEPVPLPEPEAIGIYRTCRTSLYMSRKGVRVELKIWLQSEFPISSPENALENMWNSAYSTCLLRGISGELLGTLEIVGEELNELIDDNEQIGRMRIWHGVLSFNNDKYDIWNTLGTGYFSLSPSQ